MTAAIHIFTADSKLRFPFPREVRFKLTFGLFWSFFEAFFGFFSVYQIVAGSGVHSTSGVRPNPLFLVSLVSCNLVCFLLALCLCFLPLAARNKTGLSTTRFLVDTANPLCLYLPSPDQWLLLPKLNQSWTQHWDFFLTALGLLVVVPTSVQRSLSPWATSDRLATEGKQVIDILHTCLSWLSHFFVITHW